MTEPLNKDPNYDDEGFDSQDLSDEDLDPVHRGTLKKLDKVKLFNRMRDALLKFVQLYLLVFFYVSVALPFIVIEGQIYRGQIVCNMLFIAFLVILSYL